MRQLLIASFVVLLAGCATPPSRFGNYSTAAAAVDSKMANDATAQLASMYPPALNRLNLQQPTPDGFGTDLLTALRAKGYAVAEFVPPVPGKPTPAPTSGTSLGYAITGQGENMYYLTLYVGPQVLSRIYVSESGSVYPAGAWAHKE